MKMMMMMMFCEIGFCFVFFCVVLMPILLKGESSFFLDDLLNVEARHEEERKTKKKSFAC